MTTSADRPEDDDATGHGSDGSGLSGESGEPGRPTPSGSAGADDVLASGSSPADGPDGRPDPGPADDPRPPVEGDVEGEAAAPARRGPVDVDAAWADIVARWGDAPGDREAVRRSAQRPGGPVVPSRRTPSQEGGAEGPGRRVVREPGASTPPAPGPGLPGRQVPTDDGAGRPAPDAAPVPGWADQPPGPTPPPASSTAPEPEEHYEPPALLPAPPTDRVTRLAWLGAIAGPALLLLCALVWRDAPTVVVLGAVAAFVAGFGVLVSRLPRSRDGDDGDGAVV